MKHRLISLTLILCLLLELLGVVIAASPTASGTCGEAISWSLSTDGC